MSAMDEKTRRAFERERERNRKAGRFVTLKIETRVPSKWRMVDLETGDIWKWNERLGRWRRAEGTYAEKDD